MRYKGTVIECDGRGAAERREEKLTHIERLQTNCGTEVGNCCEIRFAYDALPCFLFAAAINP